jgi:hypothetical protein
MKDGQKIRLLSYMSWDHAGSMFTIQLQPGM